MTRFAPIAAAGALALLSCARAEPPAGPAAGDVGALHRAINAAKRGATVAVPAGRYDITDLRIERDLALIGEGEVVFFSSGKVEKGLLVPGWDVSLRVENITFRDAESWDQNGAGIRHDGADLTIVNCRFIGNEDGVLATGDEKGAIEIAHSDFIDNGYGDGYSHGVYVSSGASLTITDSRFVGTRVGHHVKSLAATTVITGVAFDDAEGRTSYSVDVSRGGDLTVADSSFVKAANADNPTLINYDISRGGEAKALRITGNRIVNRNPWGRLLRNDTPLKPVIQGNDVANEGRGRFRLEG
ncbi:MAG: hypothetical protein AB7P23_10690 [Amphiplicatus sp.]